jgi:PAS domain S-box-containing protein
MQLEKTLLQSEGLMRTITDSVQDAILMMDPEGRITFWNPAAERILGYTSAEALGQDLHDLIVPVRFHSAHQAACPAFLQTGQGAAVGKTLDLEACRKDGLEISVQLSLSAVQMKDGWHTVGIIRDSTESKQAELEIQRQATFVRFNPNPVLELSASGEINYFNYATGAMARALGLESPARMLPPNTAAMVCECLAAGTPKLRVETKIGPRVISWSFFPIKFNNTVHCYGGDVTERKRAEEELRLLRCIVEQAEESVIITDAQLDQPSPMIVFVNPAFTRLTGYTAAEVLGKTPRILQGANTDKAMLARLRQTLARGEPFHGEVINYRKDGSEFYSDMHIAPIRDPNGLVTHFVAGKLDITEPKRAQQELRASEKKFQDLFESSRDAIMITEPPSWKFTSGNPAAVKMFGAKSEEDFISHTPWELSPDRQQDGRPSAEKAREMIEKAMREGSHFFEWTHRRIGGEEFPATVLISRVQSAGKVLSLATVRDITEHERFEARLFQSQKMETVGKLAGGIAHEFNSIMTAILGQSELMLSDLPEGNPLRKNAAQIHQAADRAATLTRQLLAYGRKQILQPDILDLNTVLAGMENTLRHLAGHDVDVRITPSASTMLVKADPGQIEQVIVNIVMNAADAMPRGGKLTLETAGTVLDPEYVSRFPDLKAGEYVMLAITDTGAGMSEAVMGRLFEPFFTTKEVGKGTGLGLATCHGIIKQSGGHINVYSEPGRGATFKIYLPTVQLEKKAPAPPLKSPGLPHGTETILLVEDDPALREMAAELLGRLGYTVLTAANGLEALNVPHQPATGHIDLLFTDVVMPHMSGKELADRVRALYPHTKILFTSAYTENAIVHQGVLNPGITLLQKPFTPSALAHKVREVLEQLKTPGN